MQLLIEDAPYPQKYAHLVTGQYWIAYEIQFWAKCWNVRPPPSSGYVLAELTSGWLVQPNAVDT